MSDQRTDVASWDETFMEIAKVVKKRSKDPITQVGACIVSPEKRILTLGYNGAPNGFDDEEFPWSKVGKFCDTKHAYVVHAERNAILNYRGSLKDLEDASLYVTHFPCNECAKEIAQVKIKNIIYLEEPDWEKDNIKASVNLLNIIGTSYRQYAR